MSSEKDFLRMLTVAGISAGVTLLFAPQSGEETRRDIRRKLDELKHKAEEFAQNLAEDFHEAKTEVQVKNEVEDINLQTSLSEEEKAILRQAGIPVEPADTVDAGLPVTEEEKELFNRGIY